MTSGPLTSLCPSGCGLDPTVYTVQTHNNGYEATDAVKRLSSSHIPHTVKSAQRKICTVICESYMNESKAFDNAVVLDPMDCLGMIQTCIIVKRTLRRKHQVKYKQSGSYHNEQYINRILKHPLYWGIRLTYPFSVKRHKKGTAYDKQHICYYPDSSDQAEKSGIYRSNDNSGNDIVTPVKPKP